MYEVQVIHLLVIYFICPFTTPIYYLLSTLFLVCLISNKEERSVINMLIENNECPKGVLHYLIKPEYLYKYKSTLGYLTIDIDEILKKDTAVIVETFEDEVIFTFVDKEHQKYFEDNNIEVYGSDILVPPTFKNIDDAFCDGSEFEYELYKQKDILDWLK